MHAKVVVADDTAFIGSFNLSGQASGTPRTSSRFATDGTADAIAAYVDEIRGHYPPATFPG